MQIKKNEIEKALLEAAETEFYAYGFEHASVRRIMREAGVSIGNFYNYFKNKEELYYALVGEAYHTFVHFMNQQEHEDESFFSSNLMKTPGWQQQLTILLQQVLPNYIKNILPDFDIRFVILMEGSRGTRYEHTGEQLIKLVKDHLLQHLDETGTKLPDGMCELLARQFLDGLILIIKQHLTDKDARNNLLAHYLVFYVTGVAGVMGSGSSSSSGNQIPNLNSQNTHIKYPASSNQ